MKRILLVSVAALSPSLAAAHPSILPHDHPHALSLLPDLTALLMAAVVVGAGAFVVAMRRRAQK